MHHLQKQDSPTKQTYTHKSIQKLLKQKQNYIQLIEDYKHQISAYVKMIQKLERQQSKHCKLIDLLQLKIKFQTQNEQKNKVECQKLKDQRDKYKDKIEQLVKQIEFYKKQREQNKSSGKPKTKKKSSTQSKPPVEQPIQTMDKKNFHSKGVQKQYMDEKNQQYYEADIDQQQESIISNSIRSYVTESTKKIQIRSVIYELKKPSEGIILFKQQYQKLFYDQNSFFPSLENIQILFDISNQQNSNDVISEEEAIIKFSINGKQNQQNQLQKFNDMLSSKQCSKISVQVKSLLLNGVQKTAYQQKDELTLSYKLIPCESQDLIDHRDSTQLAKQILHKKFWIKVSSSLSQAQLTVGDLVDINKLQNKNEQNSSLSALKTKNQCVKAKLGIDEMSTWNNQKLNFALNKNSGSYSKNIHAVSQIKRFQIVFTFKQIQGKSQKCYKQLIKTHFHIKVFGLCKLLSPILTKNPSPLTDHANLHILPQQIRVLYEYLQNISIVDLPKFDRKPNEVINQAQYYEWKNLRQAIHNSIITNPGCFQYQKDGQKHYIPIGILNTLMRAKSVNLHNPQKSKIFQFKTLEWNNNQVQFDQFLNKIYETRKMYIRFQMMDHEGLAPGGMAVLQIWPPYCCSSIHDHGSAFGIVKVLSNQIAVQNFKDINFIQDDQQPYLQSIYQQNQYTWLSQFAYGVHRLINLTGQTTITLQTYSGDQGSREFFSFIQKNEYCQYYPQHDWFNFLNFGNFFKNQNKLIKCSKQMKQNIYRIIKFVDIMKQFFKADQRQSNFHNFVDIMRKQYESLSYLKKQSLIDRQLKVKWIPLHQLPID